MTTHGSVVHITWDDVVTLPLASGEPISSSWHDFQKDCGVRSFLGNPVRAGKRFEDAYLDKTVRWEGRMHHVQQGIFGKQFMYLE